MQTYGTLALGIDDKMWHESLLKSLHLFVLCFFPNSVRQRKAHIWRFIDSY